MTAPASELQTAVVARLTADARLLKLLGSARIYDRAVRDAAYPYVVLAALRTTDWTTGTEPGAEHRLTFHVWSRAAGRHQAADIADALRAALADARPAMTGHRVISLQHEATELPPRNGELWQAVVRFRAVTEPAA